MTPWDSQTGTPNSTDEPNHRRPSRQATASPIPSERAAAVPPRATASRRTLLVAAVQVQSEPMKVEANRERADALLCEAHRGGAELAVLPEMFNTGYGLIPDYAPHAETADGPTLTHLRRRSREWGMGIAAGFVEREGHHLYDALGLCLPDGAVHIYRKRHLVFWESFRFRPGRGPRVVETPWGRVGLAICADMIYRRVWDAYRGGIDLALVSAAWPDFAHRETGRRHWLLGRVGGLAGEIPRRVAADLGIPVVFANQCGPTHTTIPYLGLLWSHCMPDRFAGLSSVCDGPAGPCARAEGGEGVVLSSVTLPRSGGPSPWRTTCPSASAATSSASAPS